MKKFFLICLTVGAALNAWSQCDELFISEYVEGSRNNKALEIYNPTGSTIDLSQYRITRWQNGSASWTPQYSDILTGKLESRDVVICVLDRRDTTQTGQDTPVVLPLRLKADLFLSPNYNISYSMSFNGDDAVSLDKYNPEIDKWMPVDIIGKIGERPVPAWSNKPPYTGTGTWYTVDKTLIRKDSVVSGIKKNPSIFNPEVEWELNPRDMFDSLGFHYCLCGWPAGIKEFKQQIVQLFPNPALEKTMAFLEFRLSAVRIIDSKGAEVFLETSMNNNTAEDYLIWEANTSTLSAGIYQVQFLGVKGEYATARLMK